MGGKAAAKRSTTKKATDGHPLVAAAARLRDAVAGYPGRAPVGKAAYILDPLDYAWPLHEAYLRRYGPTSPGRVEAVFVGMNPGPWGMAQTGVPFGSPEVVREFLGLEGEVTPPARTHEKRPILGLDSHRTEVSGQRLWGGIRACFGAPEPFFARFFVTNYCPLVFQSETGANLTPDKLPKDFMAPACAACDAHLREVLRSCGPRTVIGVGKWAEKQLRAVVEQDGLEMAVASILHPSPASPRANQGWLGEVRAQLDALGHAWPEPKA